MNFGNCRFAGVMLGLALSAGAQAQSTVAELLEKGGKQVTKAEILELMPMRLQAQWPTGIGEEELDFSVDGKISGSGFHYPSKTNSPAEGSWAVEDDGKFCTPKSLLAGVPAQICAGTCLSQAINFLVQPRQIQEAKWEKSIRSKSLAFSSCVHSGRTLVSANKFAKVWE